MRLLNYRDSSSRQQINKNKNNKKICADRKADTSSYDLPFGSRDTISLRNM